jgi:hypothetical protein
VGDCIPPVVQKLKLSPPGSILWMMAIDFCPEDETEKSEVGPDAARLSVPTVELATPDEPVLDETPDRCGWIEMPHQVRDALGMEVTAEPLKLRRDQHGVRLVDLLGRVTTARARAADRGVGGLDLVQRARASRQPFPLGP